MWEMSCYGGRYGDEPKRFDTLDEAKDGAEKHIREECRHGTMEWAENISWRSATLPDSAPQFSAAANGEWIDHGLKEVNSERD